MRLIDADALCEALLERWNTADQNAEEIISELMAKVVTPIVVGMPTIEQNKSRPYGDCTKCTHVYGTLGCCTTVSNEWVYDCDNGMAQYKKTKAEPSKSTDQNVADVPSGDEYVPNKACFDCMERGTGMCKGTIQEQSWCPIVAKTNAEPSGEYSKLLQTTLNGDLISRAEAIEAVDNTDWYHINKKGEMVHGATSEMEAWYKTEDIYKALDALPSADRPTLKQTDTMIIADALRYLIKDTERHELDRTRAEELREQILQYGASMCSSAERPNGEWIDKGEYAECSICGAHSGKQFNGVEPIPLKTPYCPCCGADMRGADR